jgi:hypothetical protein
LSAALTRRALGASALEATAGAETGEGGCEANSGGDSWGANDGERNADTTRGAVLAT